MASSTGAAAAAAASHGHVVIGIGGGNVNDNSNSRSSSSNNSNNNVIDDPLSQAMSMLDSLNNNQDIMNDDSNNGDDGGGFDDDDFEDDFEDFAIDSDGEEENNEEVADVDLNDDQVVVDYSGNGDGAAGVGSRGEETHERLSIPPTHWATTKQDVAELSSGHPPPAAVNSTTATSSNSNTIHSSSTIAHPLQVQEMVPSTAYSTTSSSIAKMGGAVGNGISNMHSGGTGAIGSGGSAAAAAPPGGGGSWTSSLASFVASRVTAAGGTMAPAPAPATNAMSMMTPSSSIPSTSTTPTILSTGGARIFEQQQQPQLLQQQPPNSSKMSYTERQRLLHEQYYNNYASKPSSSSSSSPSPSVTLPPPSSASTTNPMTTIPATFIGSAQSASATTSASTTNAMAPHLLFSPTSPSKTLMTSNTTTAPSSLSSAAPTSTNSLSTIEQTPTTTTTRTITTTAAATFSPSLSSSSTTTFAEKLTSSLDASTKTKLISSALGGIGDGQLLPGERVIMFINMLNDVRDCTCEHTLMMQAFGRGGGGNDALGKDDGIYESNIVDSIDVQRMINGDNKQSSGGNDVATTTVWCCAMTFYRVAVFSYQATLEGEVFFPEEEEEDEEGEEEKDVSTMLTGDDNVDSKNNNDDDDLMIQQWLRSQNVSIQFQAAHCPPSRRNSRRRQQRQRHCVFQMPLASIERVEKTLASSQIAMSGYGVGIHPSSSYSLSNPTSTGSAMQHLLPSSSSFSSSSATTASTSGAMMSSAMMSLGSQMMPLLGGMASGISGGVGSGVGSGNSNLLTNGSNKRSNALMGTETMEGYATGSGPLGIKIHGKDGGRWIAFSTCSHSDAMRAYESLNTYAFPGRRNLGYLFAFESRRAEVMMMASSASQGDGGQGIERGNNDAEISTNASAITTTTATAKPTRRRFVALEEYKRQRIFQSRCYGGGVGVSSDGGVVGGSTALAMSYGSPWAPILTANANYGLCATYPNVLVGPRSIVGSSDVMDGSSDTGSNVTSANENNVGLLRRCAAFRAGNRLPALTWGSSWHGGSIWRASQPKVGLQGNRSIEDERYLYAIGEEARRANLEADDARRRCGEGVDGSTSSQERPPVEFLRMLCGRNNESDLIMDTGSNSSCLLKIMDMRPKTSAMANRTQGYGYENTNHYRGTTINFYGIGNIHAVRDAYQKINSLCMNPNTSDVSWMQLVENTNWPSMIRLILSASWQTAFHVHYNRLPVLVHCSHGWDRTSQVPALAQLLLDPHYRTREGFSTLVEKDFLSFGHPFHTRCGHGEGKNEQGRDEEQLSPIFLQFLDCVFQLVNQFPDYFEFNSRYLLLLSEHIYSCRFGTLLCDSEKERELAAGVRQRTYCLWDYLNSIPELVNPLFDKAASDRAGVLLMPLPMLLRNVTLWTDRYCMYGSKATIPCVPPSLGHAYPPSYFVSFPSEQPLVLHTMKAGVEGALTRALSDVEMWKGTALSALKELMELKRQKEENNDERSSR